MNVEIFKITDGGVLKDERIILKVIVDDFLGSYAVFKTKKTGENTVSARTAKTFWFPDRQVKKGDLVVLYSKVGVSTERKNDDGTTTHFFYWQSTETIWNETDDAVVLLKMGQWDYKTLGGNK